MVAVCRLGKTTISRHAPCSALYRLKLSLTTRFIRLRPTARLSICRETAIPSREKSLWLAWASTLKNASEETKGFLKTPLKSASFVSLYRWVNAALRRGLVLFLTITAPITTGCDSTHHTSGGKALSALGPTGFDDGLAGTGRHARAKTMTAGTLQKTWLESTLHFDGP